MEAVSDPFEDDVDARYADATDQEKIALHETEITLDETTKEIVSKVVKGLLEFTDVLSGHPLRPYQTRFAYRFFESLVIDDGATITALFSRQSGKTETVANCVATAMIMLPRLAKIYPLLLDKYKEGVWVGAFAPTDLQAATLHNRIVQRLTSKRARKILSDPEINDQIKGKGREVWLSNCGSRVARNTAHPRANIESQTFHIILGDEWQVVDNVACDKSVVPMGSETNATNVWTGTCTYSKNVFYRDIQLNKREQLRRGARQDHFEVPWTEVAKYSDRYKRKVMREMIKMGEDSDEFRLSYKLEWLLEKGMFTTSSQIEELGDPGMQYVIHDWYKTECVAGIDCARVQDRTVVTVVFVDWNNPDQAGFVHHRVLKWLDLEGKAWEEQYFLIQEFLSHYNIWKVGVDTGGVGDVVIDRLRRLMPHIDFEEMGDATLEQSKRWKYLKQLMDRRQVTWPGGSRVRPLRTWRRFIQEMSDLQLEYRGPNMVVEAPNETGAHDDYPDSLALACILTKDAQESTENEPVITENFMMARTRR